ncbi:MAG: CapA family protein [Chloroflexota bacterium]
MKYNKRYLYLGAMIIMGISGCLRPAKLTMEPPTLPTIVEALLQTLTPPTSETPQPVNIASQADEIAVENTRDENPSVQIWLQAGLPENFLSQLDLADEHIISDDEKNADIRFSSTPNVNEGEIISKTLQWVYVLCAPFPTLIDELEFNEVRDFWRGEKAISSFKVLLVSPNTKLLFESIWGSADPHYVNEIASGQMLSRAWELKDVIAILPFEDLEPRWKVLRVGGKSPLEQTFDFEHYELTVPVYMIQKDNFISDLLLPDANFDPAKRTILVMSGVTALVRATANKMELLGNTYPGEDVKDWFLAADLTHISNEVPFAENCPSPDPFQADLVFCSNPKYIELLEFIGADIIELSGNHAMDWGVDAMNLTLDLYEERAWVYYAGGRNLGEAQAPALVDHNGNKLAFIGCNPAGPYKAWATDSNPGAAPCQDYAWLTTSIEQLRLDGYLPIVTFQFYEDYTAYASQQQIAVFEMVADAGAVVVNGSQAHTPKEMSFHGDTFIHYGLGNLFFDQMEVYYNDILLHGTRDEFIDKHVFYDGRHISVELLTARLEDYAKPRPMTETEREELLRRIFGASGW